MSDLAAVPLPGYEIERHRSRKFTVQQVDETLLQLALTGSPRKAMALVREHHGWEIDENTIGWWASTAYPNKFAHIRQQVAPKVEETIVANARLVALKAMEVQILALDQTRAQLEAGEVKEPHRVIRDAAVAGGVNVTKILELEGRPSAIVEHRTVDDALAVLQRLGLITETPVAIAEDITDELTA